MGAEKKFQIYFFLRWFARHEFRLFWRDWTSMMTAGKRRRLDHTEPAPRKRYYPMFC